ncbi:MAG: molybdopterin-dependent oxidoreductase, partial [Burkholderiales bacterium]|nr:molybdopterin-dependent oxidoreductase [Burkholderiales bacterium]
MTNRRNFLKIAAATGAATVLPTARAATEPEQLVTAVPPGEQQTFTLKGGVQYGSPLPGMADYDLTKTYATGKSTFIKNTCMTASHWGVAKVHVYGGKIERLEPFFKDLSPSLQLQSFGRQPYNEARIRYPMVRKSFLEKGIAAGGDGRGSEPFVRVSWDKAAELVAEHVKRVQEQYGPTAIYGGSYGWFSPGQIGNARSLLQRMLNLAGGFTGNYGDYSTGCAQVILPYVIGSNGVYEQVTAWDLICDKTELIVLWGCDPTITNDIDWCTTVHEDCGGFERVKKAGIPCVAVNPLKPDTAEFFGEQCQWIAPRPGTDVAMMAAMCWELVKSGKADTNFIKKYTYGFEQFRDYLSGKEDGVEKTAEWASKICDVPAETIVNLANAMREKRSMLMGGWGIQRALYGEQVHWMMVALASICGHIGLPGGGFGFTYHYSNGGAPTSIAPVLPAISANPKVKQEGPAWITTASARIPVAGFCDCFLNPGKEVDYNGGKITYPDIKMVMWSGGNPYAQQEQTNRIVEAWKKPEVVVICDSMWTASARFADIVLPACTALERDDITSIGSYSNMGYVAMHKAIEPQYESKSDYEIYRLISRKLGFEDAYTEGLDEIGWVRRFYETAALEAKENGTLMPTFEEFWKGGYVLFPVPEESAHYNYFGDFRKNPVINALGTESGKIQLYSPKIASYKYDDCPPHPTWLEPTEWLGGEVAKEYPFALLTSKSRYRLHSQLDSTASHEYADIQKREPCWIHPDAARILNVKDGDILEVESKRGRVLAGAVVTDRVRPDVVVIRHGAWYCPEKPGEVGSLDVHGCDNVLTEDVPSSKLSRGNCANSWLVKVKKYEGELKPIWVWEQ